MNSTSIEKLTALSLVSATLRIKCAVRYRWIEVVSICFGSANGVVNSNPAP